MQDRIVLENRQETNRDESRHPDRPASVERRRFNLALAGLLSAAALPLPRTARAAAGGALALDVDGQVRVTNNAAHTAYHFSEADLLKLPVHAISTATTWTPRSTFTGPLLTDVLKTVGAYGSQIEIHTIDDYTCLVPMSDAARFGAVLAYAMNGQRLKVSDFGPLFLIYPRDQFPLELDGAAGDSKFAWQIVSMTIKA
ncbi:molybdopterin-dependent oxidoreductase [Paraburkholderia sp. Ac-20340]|uniref:molybdopterin-dependent oxidoreductase n=1 Tax=Paraburkholderia sp. Ac-20340 TaxID=2703888 RepID=UPI00197D307D|nr:molybdopterin-dependent oxidoreductase [Paraburkholderia sp. Ac-20340]MBN3858272.1 molybdopterin-dependent oxidoreductase [Paraburkholderia sp. Ac-20340]